jgi:hypothetical protein
LKIQYTKDEVTIWYNGERNTEKLKIAAKDKDTVVLIGKDPFDDEDKLFLTPIFANPIILTVCQLRFFA